MKTLNSVRDAVATVEWYLRAHDPAQPWPVEMVALACAAATAGQQPRLALIAAKALRTLPDAERLAIEGAGNFPGQVRAADTTQDWPAPLTPAGATLDLPAFKARTMARIHGMIDATAIRIAGTYPLWEVHSWTAKEAAARAYLADPDSVVPADLAMLSAEAVRVSATLADLAARIVGNADAWKPASGALAGVRSSSAAAIAAAEDAAGVEAALTTAAAELAEIETPA